MENLSPYQDSNKLVQAKLEENNAAALRNGNGVACEDGVAELARRLEQLWRGRKYATQPGAHSAFATVSRRRRMRQ